MMSPKPHTRADREMLFWSKNEMSKLARSASFEDLCYGSTAITNIFTLTVRGSTYT